MFEHVDAQRIVRVYEEAWPVEQRRELRSSGAPGSPSFWLLFLRRSKKKWLAVGLPPTVLVLNWKKRA